MTTPAIASLTSASGRHSGRIYHDRATGGFRTIFYVDGIAQRDADAFTASEAEALEETAYSLRVADEIYAGLQARLTRRSETVQ